MLNLSLCSCHRRPAPRPHIETFDARPRRGDPTGTSGLKTKMGAAADKRWQLFARTLRQAIIERDLLGLRGVSQLPHSDKTDGLAAFVEAELRQKVFARGLWLRPYVQEAARLAQVHAEIGQVDPQRVAAMQSYALSELRGVVELAQQHITRIGTHSMLAAHTPHKMWNLLAAVIRSMRERTRLMIEHVIAKTHATSTLSAYRDAGITHVGIVPEHVKSVTHVPRRYLGTADGIYDEDLPSIRVPVAKLVSQARKYYRERAETLGRRYGTEGAVKRLEKELQKEEERLNRNEAKWAEELQKRGDEFIAKRQAEGEAERARQELMREELRQRLQSMVPLPARPGQPAKPERAKSTKGLLQTKEERKQTPSPAVISRIEQAQRRLEIAFAGGKVDVITAGDDRVCQECEDIEEEGPYTLEDAEDLIPAHPRCRCAFVPAGKYAKDSYIPRYMFDEGPGHPFRGNQYTGGISGEGQEGREGEGGRGGGPGGARSPDEAQRSAEAAAAGHPKLEGLPDKPIKVGDEYYVPGPFGKAQDAAAAYMQKAGLPYDPPKQYQKVDPERAGRIADAFEKMQHAPDDPKVKASYEALAKETVAQWHAIRDTGLKVEWIKPGQADPYAKTPRLAAMDVIQNNHWWGFPTDAGFGSGAEAEAARHNNPMLKMTDEVVDGRRLMVNDVFRIVHDYFGHFKEGVGFRADGEENAWRSHAAMYSALARGAMTSETRGQNSWVNYGPYGATNRTASAADTHFAPQKIGLMPEWTHNEGRKDRIKDEAAGHPFRGNQYTGGISEGGKAEGERPAPGLFVNPSKEDVEKWRKQVDDRMTELEKARQSGGDEFDHLAHMSGALEHWQKGGDWAGETLSLHVAIGAEGKVEGVVSSKYRDAEKVAEITFGGAHSQEAMTAVLNSAVAHNTELGAKRVEGTSFTDDKMKMGAYEKAGFKREASSDLVTTWGHGLAVTPEQIEQHAKHETEHREMVEKAALGVAADMGFPKDKVRVGVEGSKEDREYVLNGRTFHAAGIAYTQSPDPEKRGTIVIYPKRAWDEKSVQGTTAHEIEHIKFQQALDRYELQRRAVMNEPAPPPKPESEHPWERRGGGDAIMHPDGTLRPGYAEKYPAYHEMEKTMHLPGQKIFEKGDGVSEYSSEYWKQYADRGRTTEDFRSAMHETLAEMSRIKYMTGKFPEHTRMFKVFEGEKLGEVASGKEKREATTLYRDLFRTVERLYKS